MALAYKVLGQASPAAATYTDLFTSPSATETVVSTIVVANRQVGASTFRIAVRPAGETLSDKHFIAYNVGIEASDSTTLTLGITLAPTDVVTVWSLTNMLSFSAFGTQIS
jgi:hypothetical protein